MQFKQLDKFIEDYNLNQSKKLIKYLIIIGIHSLKQKTNDISNDTIKLIANSCKDNSLTSELKSLRKKVMSLEKHLSQPRNSNEREIKYHSQPKITPKITEQVPPSSKQQKPLPFKHHLDDSEIKSILWNQFNFEPQQSTTESYKREKPIVSGHVHRNSIQECSSGQITHRDLQSYRQQTGRSSHSSLQMAREDRNSPKFKEEQSKQSSNHALKEKENRIPTSDSQKSLPKHLKKVESKIKQQVKQDRQLHKSNANKMKEIIPEEMLSSENTSYNILNTTPQHKQFFQPCNSTHFGAINLSSQGKQFNLDSNKIQNISTDRKMINLDEIASTFLNSPFMKSQVKQKLFRQQSNLKDLSQHSSVSSNFSLFHPNNDLKSFFQKEYLEKVQNSISFQF